MRGNSNNNGPERELNDRKVQLMEREWEENGMAKGEGNNYIKSN